MKPIKYLILLIILVSQAFAEDHLFAKGEHFASVRSDSFVYTTYNSRVRIKVEIERFTESDYKEHYEEVDGYRQVVKVTQGDRELPIDIGFYQFKTVIKAFSIELDGKEIPFDKNYWADIAGLDLVDIKTNLDLSKKENRRKFHWRVHSTDNPVPLLSDADGIEETTIYFRWIRREDGDTSTTFRWILSPDGKVQRHAEYSQFYDSEH